jgi:hypothetical protein
MTTNKPIELGKASEETKDNGPEPMDRPGASDGELEL